MSGSVSTCDIAINGDFIVLSNHETMSLTHWEAHAARTITQYITQSHYYHTD